MHTVRDRGRASARRSGRHGRKVWARISAFPSDALVSAVTVGGAHSYQLAIRKHLGNNISVGLCALRHDDDDVDSCRLASPCRNVLATTPTDHRARNLPAIV